MTKEVCMKKTLWTVARMNRLYRHYNRKFWHGELPTCRLRLAKCEDCVAWAKWRTKEIQVDVDQIDSDGRVRSTLLHEMAHIANGRQPRHHGSAFFAELERLLSMGAPISVSFPENENRVLLQTVPRKFRRCRAALKHKYRVQQRILDQEAKETGLETVSLKGELESDFYEAGFQGLSWRAALLVIGRRYGLLDIDDRPLPCFGRYMKLARGCFRRGRRELLEERKHRARWEAMMRSTPSSTAA
jgi:hypothetical protein